MKSGIGTCSVRLGSGVIVAALIAVNALGDVIDPSSGHIIAGARKAPASGEFADSAAVIRQGARRPAGGNTVLAVVATNARLDRVQTNKLAALASLGVARTISPANTMNDGDITFAISVGKERASVDEVGVAAADAMATAVIRAVRAARTAGGVPGLAG
jgi:L-aminopeptidase/D-esterase-like protein